MTKKLSYTRNRVRTLVQLAKQKLILTNVNHGEFVFLDGWKQFRNRRCEW